VGGDVRHRHNVALADVLADTLKSTLHRVTLPPLADRIQGEEKMTRERYSIVYFVGANPDAVVECLPACVDDENPPKYEPITQKAYCEMRSKVQYRSPDSTAPS
jgi:isopenicillin N synthase-like dioxygenase